jgi:hypothetical protein
MTTKYKVVRYYYSGRKVTIYTGLTEEQAQERCSDPETSSKTCTSWKGRNRTKLNGYTEDHGGR